MLLPAGIGKAMTYELFGGNGVIATNSTTYSFLNGNGTTPSGATENNFMQVAPTDGTFSKLRVTQSAASGAGKSITYTVMIGQQASNLSCAISGATDTTCSITLPVRFLFGQIVDMRTVSTVTTGTTRARWTVVVNTDAQSLGPNVPLGSRDWNLFGGWADTTLNGITTTGYIPFHAGYQVGLFTEFGAQTLMPMSGTARAFSVYCQPNGGNATWTFTVRKNGSNQLMTTTLNSGTGGLSYDFQHQFSFVAGDTISLLVNGNLTNPPIQCGVGMWIISANDGDFAVSESSASTVGTALTRSNFLASAASTWVAVGNNVSLGQTAKISQVANFKAIYVALDGTLSSGSYTFTLNNGSDTSLATTTTALLAYATGTIAATDSATYYTKSTPNSTPTPARAADISYLLNLKQRRTNTN